MNGKFYKIDVRPTTMYGTVCWALNKKEERNTKVAETRTAKVMRGVTRLYRIRNEYIMSLGGLAGKTRDETTFGRVKKRRITTKIYEGV